MISRGLIVGASVWACNGPAQIEPLCKRLFAALKKDVDAKILDAERCELLFMDDESVGSDKTLEIVTKLRNEGSRAGAESEVAVVKNAAARSNSRPCR